MFTVGAYGSALVLGAGASRDIYMLYVQRMVYISRFLTMVIEVSLKRELILDITDTLGTEQGFYFFIWKMFTMTLVWEFEGFLCLLVVGFVKGLIKPDFAKLSGVLFIFF